MARNVGPPGLFDGRHSFTLTPVVHGGTHSVQAEVFTGASTPFIGSILGKTEAGFAAMNAALFSRLEKGVPADLSSNVEERS